MESLYRLFCRSNTDRQGEAKENCKPDKKQYFGRLYASGITDKEELTKLLGNRDVEIVIEKYE